MKSSVEVVGSEIVIRIQASDLASTPSDRLIRVDQEAMDKEGLELEGIRRKIAEGDLPSLKIGRARFVRFSDLLGLAKCESGRVRKAKPADEIETGYADLTARARGRR